MSDQLTAKNIDEDFAACSAEVQALIDQNRSTIREVVPQAQEKICYRMPAFFVRGTLIYFAAFKTHIGVYRSVRGDAKLVKNLAPYRGPKGNLKFPRDRPMPYGLIKNVIKSRIKEHLEHLASKSVKK